MINVTVIDRTGVERAVEAEFGYTLMEAIRDAGFDDLIGQCGGCCSCATCHVLIDETWAQKVGRPDDMEAELLDTSPHRQDNSRLGCQITLINEFDGLRVTMAPED